MPIVESGGCTIDYLEAGSGPTVILYHSSVSAARQWAPIVERLSANYHAVAPNFFGYARTRRPGAGAAPSLDDYVALADPFLADGQQVAVIGHSFGGAVAMRAAMTHPDQVKRLVLFEPNPFRLLEIEGQTDLYADIQTLYGKFRESADADDWSIAAEHFANAWNGPGSWDRMSRERRLAFTWALPPVRHEWGAIFADGNQGRLCESIQAPTVVAWARDTVPVISTLAGIMQRRAPHWKFEPVAEGGHMFPATQVDLAYSIIEAALRGFGR